MAIEVSAAREFFRSQVKDLTAATRAVLRASSAQLKADMQRQVRQRFKRGTYSNGSFFKGFKVYNLDGDASRGPASYVRAGVPFMGIFEDGATVTPKGKYLIMLLPTGEKLGFKRITKGNSWDKVYNRYKRNLQIVKQSDRTFVLYKYQGKTTPIYMFQRQARIGKKISFYDAAEAIARQIPEQIAKLL